MIKIFTVKPTFEKHVIGRYENNNFIGEKFGYRLNNIGIKICKVLNDVPVEVYGLVSNDYKDYIDKDYMKFLCCNVKNEYNILLESLNDKNYIEESVNISHLDVNNALNYYKQCIKNDDILLIPLVDNNLDVNDILNICVNLNDYQNKKIIYLNKKYIDLIEYIKGDILLLDKSHEGTDLRKVISKIKSNYSKYCHFIIYMMAGNECIVYYNDNFYYLKNSKISDIEINIEAVLAALMKIFDTKITVDKLLSVLAVNIAYSLLNKKLDEKVIDLIKKDIKLKHIILEG